MILVFGSLNADLVFRMREVPAPGQTLLADALAVQPGGKGANQAVAAARAGAAVRLVGAVGVDALAAVALGGPRDAGVDVSGVRRLEGVATGCASICTDAAGRNQIAVALGANALARADWAGPVPSRATVLLQMEAEADEVAALMRRARAAGARVVLNLAPFVPLPAETLRLADLLVVNEDEAEALAALLGCDADAAALRAALHARAAGTGPRAGAAAGPDGDAAPGAGTDVLRTLGARGAEAATASGVLRVAAPSVRAVDTTAAGDCFVGVLAAALEEGMGLEAAMRRGCAAAALACTVAGSQGSLPGRAAIEAALEAPSPCPPRGEGPAVPPDPPSAGA